MKVLKAFDFYQPGQIMTPEDIADQARRGNLPDLLKNGFVADDEAVAVTSADPVVDYDSMTTNQLKALARKAEIPGYYKMKKADLIKALS